MEREELYRDLYFHTAAWLRYILAHGDAEIRLKLDESIPTYYQDIFHDLIATFCHCIDLQKHFDELMETGQEELLRTQLEMVRDRTEGLERGCLPI